jgi:hypothetical protein
LETMRNLVSLHESFMNGRTLMSHGEIVLEDRA